MQRGLKTLGLVLVLLLAVPVAGCSLRSGDVKSGSDRSLAAVEIALTNAEMLALKYTSLPRCAPEVPQPCSDAEIVARIKEADAKAYALVVAARQDSAKLPDALRAVNEMSAMLKMGD